jgi:hypothetical protein
MRSSVVLFVFLLLVSPAFAQSPGGWLRDDLTGCYVWNSNPEIGKTFHWTGHCGNNVADGPGVMQWYVNGSPSGRYVGQYYDGRMSGRGVFAYRNGDRYDGEFRDDKPNGSGTLTRANGTRYHGLFRDGQPLHEEAAADKKTSEAEPHKSPATHGQTIHADGSRYEGEMRNGERNGRGVLEYASGDLYEGDFDDGQMSGWGVFTTKAGDRYEGEFANNKPNGFGTYKEADGSTYPGLWTNGCFRQSNRVAAVMATAKECSFGVRGRPY